MATHVAANTRAYMEEPNPAAPEPCRVMPVALRNITTCLPPSTSARAMFRSYKARRSGSPRLETTISTTGGIYVRTGDCAHFSVPCPFVPARSSDLTTIPASLCNFSYTENERTEEVIRGDHVRSQFQLHAVRQMLP